MSQVTSPAATIDKFVNYLSFWGLWSPRPLPSQPATTALLACDSPHSLPMTDPALKALHSTFEAERGPGFVKNGGPEMTWTEKNTKLEIKTHAASLHLCYIIRWLSSWAPCSLEHSSVPLCLDSLGFLGCLLLSHHVQPVLSWCWQRWPCSRTAVNLIKWVSFWLLISRASVEYSSQIAVFLCPA